jgi:hypothetical protein
MFLPNPGLTVQMSRAPPLSDGERGAARRLHFSDPRGARKRLCSRCLEPWADVIDLELAWSIGPDQPLHERIYEHG